MKTFAHAAAVLVLAIVYTGSSRADWPNDNGPPFVANQLSRIFESGKALANSKDEANRAIADARTQFFADFEDPQRGPIAERQFMDILFAKDIYYLSLYLPEGMTPAAVQRLAGIDRLTGGPLDAGLALPFHPLDSDRLSSVEPAEFFSVWIDAVRKQLNAPPPGSLWLPSQDALLAAIGNTSSEYTRYRVVRDQFEYNRWQLIHAIPVNIPKTPEGYVDTYIKYFLNPQIKAALAAIPEADRPAANEKIVLWREQLQVAMVMWERTKASADDAVEVLRKVKVPENLVTAFLNRVDAAKQNGEVNLQPVIVSALIEALDAKNRMDRHPTGYFRPARIEASLKQTAYSRGAGKLSEEQLQQMPPDYVDPDLVGFLYGPGQPFKFRRDPYFSVREQIVAGKVATFPELHRRR